MKWFYFGNLEGTAADDWGVYCRLQLLRWLCCCARVCSQKLPRWLEIVGLTFRDNQVLNMELEDIYRTFRKMTYFSLLRSFTPSHSWRRKKKRVHQKLNKLTPLDRIQHANPIRRRNDLHESLPPPPPPTTSQESPDVSSSMVNFWIHVCICYGKLLGVSISLHPATICLERSGPGWNSQG